MSFRITNIWAFVARGDDDEDGLIAAMVDGQWMPFVSADRTRVEALRPVAMSIARRTNKTVELRRFDNGIVEETYLPSNGHSPTKETP